MSNDVGRLLLRVTLSVLILLHGVSKIMKGIAPIESLVQGVGLPAILAFGVYIGEVLAPILLLLGYYARVGALLIAVNMIFAISLAHRQEILGLTPQGGYSLELQAMFLFTAIALVLLGPGSFSINRR